MFVDKFQKVVLAFNAGECSVVLNPQFKQVGSLTVP